MSSRESYAEKRADLINFITDQILHGVYKTQREQSKTVDLISGQEKTVDIVKPKQGNGPSGIEREEDSPIQVFGLNAYNITINQIIYDAQVEEQIKKQQEALMSVQSAIIDARKAEQKAITVAKEGEAEAAKAKWTQEIEKAKLITQAEQQRDVAKLELETAKLVKEQAITEAQGQAEARKLVLNADNALKMRLDYYLEVQKAWAAAIAAHRLTPDIQLGTTGTSNPNALMELWTAKAAKDIGVDLSTAKK